MHHLREREDDRQRERERERERDKTACAHTRKYNNKYHKNENKTNIE